MSIFIRLARLTFAATVVLAPLSPRWVLVDRPVGPLYPEFTSAIVYLSDGAVLLTLAFWVAALAVSPRATRRLSVGITKLLMVLGDTPNPPPERALPFLDLPETRANVPRPTSMGPWLLTVPLLAFVGLTYASLAWAQSPTVTAETAGRLVLLLGLYLFAANGMADGGGRRLIVLAFVAGAAIESAVAIAQWVGQGPIGLTALGELPVTVDGSGPATIQTSGGLWLRPYGLSTHPNLLAGYLFVGWCAVVGLVAGWAGRRPNPPAPFPRGKGGSLGSLEATEKLPSPRGGGAGGGVRSLARCPTREGGVELGPMGASGRRRALPGMGWGNNLRASSAARAAGALGILGLISGGLAVTFSRSAWLALLVALVVLVSAAVLSREWRRVWGVLAVGAVTGLSFAVVAASYPDPFSARLWLDRLRTAVETQLPDSLSILVRDEALEVPAGRNAPPSLTEKGAGGLGQPTRAETLGQLLTAAAGDSARDFFKAQADEVIATWPSGVGAGGYTIAAYRLRPSVRDTLPIFVYLPVHDVWYLTRAELGPAGPVVLTAVFLGPLLALLLRRLRRRPGNPFVAAWLAAWCGLIAVGFFDYYLLGSQPGRLLLWLTAGSIAAALAPPIARSGDG